MKRLNTFFRYIIRFFLMLFALLVLDVLVTVCIQGTFDEGKRIAASVSVTASQLEFESGEIIMSDKGKAKIDLLDGFAILIDESGRVIWEYRKPADVPTAYTLSDIASFSRWYLCDYPVYSYIIELPDGGSSIFVLGQPKGSLWKYQLTVGINTLYRYPYIFAADMLILFTVPMFITKRGIRRREKERAEWIAGISHDIRTPLTMAMLRTAKIANESSDKNAAETAKQALSHEMRLKSLVENLNADNRMQYGYGRLVREKVDPSSVIRDVLCDFADANDGLPYDFECLISPDARNCIIRSDEVLFRRLLENIVGNSIRHNPDGCTVTVELHRQKNVLLRPRCILKISDNGCGAAPETIAALNSRNESSVLRDHGLGLRVVSHIAERYHWKIRYSSSVGECFSVEIRI